MGLNPEALKVKVKKAILKLPSIVDVERHVKNDYNELAGNEPVTQLTGLYHKAQNSFISQLLAERGETKSRQSEYFMTVIDADSLKVQEGDFFTLNGTAYKIVDLGNAYNVYFDFALERV